MLDVYPAVSKGSVILISVRPDCIYTKHVLTLKLFINLTFYNCII